MPLLAVLSVVFPRDLMNHHVPEHVIDADETVISYPIVMRKHMYLVGDYDSFR